MTLQNAIEHLKALQAKTSKKSEIKIYQKFIETLNSLEQKPLSESESKVIEAELEAIDQTPSPEKGAKYYRKAFNKFEKQLRDKLSLISKNYYTNLGVGLGSSFGVLVGVVFLSSLERSMGIALGISLGMLIGLLIGRSLDSQAQNAGKVL